MCGLLPISQLVDFTQRLCSVEATDDLGHKCRSCDVDVSGLDSLGSVDLWILSSEGLLLLSCVCV